MFWVPLISLQLVSQKTAALKICDFGVYIFIFVDFSEKSSVSWKPKDLKINSKLMALFHREQLYRAKDQFPKKLVLCLVNIILSSAPRGTQYSHSDLCTLVSPPSCVLVTCDAPWRNRVNVVSSLVTKCISDVFTPVPHFYVCLHSM